MEKEVGKKQAIEKKDIKVTGIKSFWKWLWRSDSILSWLVLFLIAFVVVRFIFFPIMSFATGSSLPLVVIESCSMNHPGFIGNFENWWQTHKDWYEARNISKEQMEEAGWTRGMKMGDIIVVSNRRKIESGNVIIFKPNKESLAPRPIIHRVINLSPIATKGDANQEQLKLNNNVYRTDETNISQEQVIGKAVFKIPRIGWAKLIFVKIYELIKGVPQDPWC